jgi:FKBP-type peptidyl-prolyl cis-trans isomerase (trigger factor)
MKAEVRKIDATKREVSVEVSGEVVKNKFEDIFKKIGLEAKVPGFRPGHAPRDILEKHYSAHAHEQVLKELVPDVYNKVIDQEKLEVVELPEIFDVKLDRDKLSFKAKVEVSPEITLGNYKRIKINYQKLSVSDDEVRRSIDALKESRKVEAIDDGLARALGYPNLAELESAVQRQIFIQKDNQQRQKIETEIIEHITKDMDFKLPQRLVDRQLEDLLRQAKLDLALRGVPTGKIEEESKGLAQELEPEAKRQVKVYLVFAAIAKKENINQDDHMPRRVTEFLLKEADWQGQV